MEPIIPTPESESQVQDPVAADVGLETAVPTPGEPTIETESETETADVPESATEELAPHLLPPTTRAKWLRNIAGIFFVLGSLLSLQFLILIIDLDIYPSMLVTATVITWVANILLICLSPNRTIKIALTSYLVIQIIFSLAYSLILLCPPIVNRIYNIVWALGLVYLLSLIVQNSKLSKKELGWINVLFILTIFSSLSVFATDFYLLEDRIHHPGSNWLFWWIIKPIFDIIACWKVCHFSIFNGHKDNTIVPNYSPINRYTIGAVVSLIVATMGMWLIYSNAEWFLNIL